MLCVAGDDMVVVWIWSGVLVDDGEDDVLVVCFDGLGFIDLVVVFVWLCVIW